MRVHEVFEIGNGKASIRTESSVVDWITVDDFCHLSKGSRSFLDNCEVTWLVCYAQPLAESCWINYLYWRLAMMPRSCDLRTKAGWTPPSGVSMARFATE